MTETAAPLIEPPPAAPTPNCIMRAWTTHESELRRWLRTRVREPADADDLMQELFIKALRQGHHVISKALIHKAFVFSAP
jgi:RNA polymerase sigma-70 factor (ECF subfamily)